MNTKLYTALYGKYRAYDPRVQFSDRESQEDARTIWSTESIDLAYTALETGLPIKKDPFFKGNALLKKAGLIYRLTTAEQTEYAKCKANILYFAENYCQLLNEDAEYAPITLRAYQKKILVACAVKKYVIVLGSRQIGKTTTTAIFILWLTLFHPLMQIALLGDKIATATENLNKIKEILYRLPFFLKPGIVAWNVRSCVFHNGSKILTGPCNKASLVGKTINVLYIDELAIPHPRQSRELVEYAFPTIEAIKKGKIIVTSTPSGTNVFKELWQGAVYNKNGFFPIKVPWFLVPGRDMQWREQKIAMLGGNISAFNEQFNCKFLSSTTSIFAEELIKRWDRLANRYREPDQDERLLSLVAIIQQQFNNQDVHEPYRFFQLHKSLELADLAELPILVTVDLGDGLRGDYTSMTFFKLSNLPSKQNTTKTSEINDWLDAIADENPSNALGMQLGQVRLEQIALWHCNIISIELAALWFKVFTSIYLTQHKLRVVVEMNRGSGHIFNKVLLSEHLLPQYEIEPEVLGRTEIRGKEEVGVLTTPKTKPLMVKAGVALLESGKMLISHPVTIEEAKHFGQDERGRFAGGDGFHDDAIDNVLAAGAYVDPLNNNFLQWLEELSLGEADTANDEAMWA